MAVNVKMPVAAIAASLLLLVYFVPVQGQPLTDWLLKGQYLHLCVSEDYKDIVHNINALATKLEKYDDEETNKWKLKLAAMQQPNRRDAELCTLERVDELDELAQLQGLPVLCNDFMKSQITSFILFCSEHESKMLKEKLAVEKELSLGKNLSEFITSSIEKPKYDVTALAQLLVRYLERRPDKRFCTSPLQDADEACSLNDNLNGLVKVPCEHLIRETDKLDGFKDTLIWRLEIVKYGSATEFTRWMHYRSICERIIKPGNYERISALVHEGIERDHGNKIELD